MATKSDAQINQDVFDELEWDPAIQVSDLNIDTFQGSVRLTGKVRNYRTKEEATAATYRVGGVQYVHNELVVDPREPDILNNSSLADAIRLALQLDDQVPDQRVNVQVTQGHVTLTGSVDWAYQRQAALDDVLKIKGVASVDNQITLTPPHAPADEIQRRIARAFARHAELPDDKIVVVVEWGHVTLSGQVKSWGQCYLAENTAWKAPGVTEVTNKIAVGIS